MNNLRKVEIAGDGNRYFFGPKTNLHLNMEYVQYVVVDMTKETVQIYVRGLKHPIIQVKHIEEFDDSFSKWFIRCTYDNSLDKTRLSYYINPKQIIGVFQYTGSVSSVLSFVDSDDIFVQQTIEEIKEMIDTFYENLALRAQK